MNKKGLTLSLLTAAVFNQSNAVEVTSFTPNIDIYSAENNGIIYSLPLDVLNQEGFTANAHIDLSTTNTPEEAVTKILISAPDSSLARMLENYPSIPTSVIGIEYYQSIFGEGLTTDEEFQNLIGDLIEDNKYEGAPLITPQFQFILTKTADHLIIVDASEQNLENLYQCSKDEFNPEILAENQPSCMLKDEGIKTSPHQFIIASNGSYRNNSFLYNDENTLSTHYYNDEGDTTTLPGGDEFNILGINPYPYQFSFVTLYDHKSSNDDFRIYATPDTVDINDVAASIPDSTLVIFHNKAYFDKEYSDGNYLTASEFFFLSSTPLTHSPTSTQLPLKLRNDLNNDSFGFSKNFTVNENEQSFFIPSFSFIATGYYGSSDLDVITPVIFSRESDQFTYLSPEGVAYLELNTPEGFISAVREAVVNSLPDALANSYPELPDDLSELDIDPDIQAHQFRALVDERIIRAATSGALQQFNQGLPVSVNQTDGQALVSEARWNSNELSFTSDYELSAPYATYVLNTTLTAPTLNESLSSSSLSSTNQDSAELTLGINGEFGSAVVSCSVESETAILIFENTILRSWSDVSEASYDLSEDNTNLRITAMNPEDTFVDSQILEAKLTAVDGYGEATLSCTLFTYNTLGMQSENQTVSALIAVTDEFHQGDLTLSGSLTATSGIDPSSVISAKLINSEGIESELTINDDFSFTESYLDAGIYTLAVNAEGYISPCRPVSLNSSTELRALALLSGDLNNDGKINKADLRRFYLRSFITGDYDLNNDGAINRADRDIIYANIGAAQCDL